MNTEQLKTDRTKEEILEISIGNKYAKCIQKPFTDEYFYPTSAIYKAMQEFASQESKIAVDEFKEKLKDKINDSALTHQEKLYFKHLIDS